MHTNHSAKAVIGCDITGKLPDAREERVCSHEVPENHKNCADCGKPRVRKVRIEMDTLPEYKALKKAGLDVVESGDNEARFAGFVVATNGNGKPVRGGEIDFGNAKVDLRGVLEPLGLWDEKSFGLWSVLDWGN